MVALVVYPIWHIQFLNLLFNRTSYQKYGYKKNGVFSSMSSNGSILLKDSEDWSHYSKKENIFEVEDKGCCRKKQQRLSETRNINQDIF